MSRRGFSLVGVLSLICLGGYSHCPCDDPEGIESVQRGYLTLDDPSPYETEIISMGVLRALANIAGGTGQNRLKVFWSDSDDGLLSNPQSQTLCEGSCYGLHTVMNAPCFSFMKGSRANLACYLNSQWTTSEVPSDGYANATFAANTNAIWGALYDPTAGNYDIWKRDSLNWNLEFNYSGTGTHWDAQFGSIEAALCASDDDLWLAADEVFTNRLDYNLHQFDFSGSLKASVNLYSGAVPSGFNGYFRSKIEESGDDVIGAFFIPPGQIGPGATAYSVNGTDATLNYKKLIQQFSGSFSAVPSLNLFATESRWGAVNNVILPTQDNRFTLTRVSPDGNASTSRIRQQWDQTPWTGMAIVNPSQYLVAVSLPTDAMGSQRRLAGSNQVGGGATLTVELITLGSYLNFAQFADGQGLSSEVTATNTGAEEETVGLLLRDTEGVDLTFDVTGDEITIPGTAHTGRYEITIPPYGVRTLRTDGAGEVVVGSARIEASSNISAVIAFGGAFGLAGVGNSVALSEGFTAPMQTDRSRGLNTGVAVQNLAQSGTTLTAELYSTTGELVSTAAPVDLAPLGQKAIYVDQFEWDTEVDFTKFQGILKVTATGRTAATVLQTRPSQLASMPVRPLRD